MRKKYDVFITQTAQIDIEDIHSYISQDSVTNATKLIRKIEKKILVLESYPERNPTIPENEYFGTSYRHLIFSGYRIIYRISNKNVFIMRVLHGKRLLGEVRLD